MQLSCFPSAYIGNCSWEALVSYAVCVECIIARFRFDSQYNLTLPFRKRKLIECKNSSGSIDQPRV